MFSWVPALQKRARAFSPAGMTLRVAMTPVLVQHDQMIREFVGVGAAGRIMLG